MPILYALTALLLALSLARDRQRTARALRIALKRFTRIAPAFIVMLVLVAVLLYALPERLLAQAFARESKWLGLVSALGLGSVSVMPGFVAFPLCGILLERGALYMVLSAFSTTLMLIGVATFPMERTYLGTRLALLRNLAGFVIAIGAALATGLVFGEVGW